jgi:hypothetical protein
MRAIVAGLLSALVLVLLTASTPARAQQPPVELRLTLDHSAYEPGTPIRFTLRLLNISTAPVTLGFATSQRYDVILRSESVVVDRWSRTQVFVPAQTQQRLMPGQIETFVGVWLPTSALLPSSLPGDAPMPVPRGVFQVVAVLTSTTWQATSQPQPLIIGEATTLPPGCTTLPTAFTLDLPVEAIARAIDPPQALVGLWQPSLLFGVYAGYQPRFPVASNLRVINRLYPLTICLDLDARVILP